MATSFCPQCHRPMPHLVREGVSMTPLKARIFDVIERSKDSGITIEYLNRICFDGRSSPVNIRMHIHQINELLSETEVRIRGKGGGMAGFYHVRRG